MKPIVGYQMTAELAEEFFNRCIKRGAETPEARIKILQELRDEHLAVGLNAEDIIRRIKYKKVLRVK